MKKLIFTAAFLTPIYFFGNLAAQSVSPSVVGNAGTFYSNASGQLQWTLGEVMIQTFSASGNIITQGMHQPDYGVLTAIKNEQHGILSVYPNPVSEQFTIDLAGIKVPVTITIYSNTGDLVYSETISNVNKKTITLRDLSSGMYCVNITGAGIFSSVKVIKAN